MLRGRSFGPHDTATSQPVIIIDQLVADRYFAGQDPIGKRIRVQTDEKGRKMHTIVGVVPHLKVYGFGETNELPQAYFAQTQVQSTPVVLLRSSLPRQRSRNRCAKSSPRSIRRNRSSTST